MIDFLTEYMLWIKAFHVMGVISWMAGIFYLPRLFVYHQETQNPALWEQFKVMERKLYRIIMQPAMHFSLITGILLATIQDVWTIPWFHLKLTGLFFLFAYHFFLDFCRKQLEQEKCQFSGRFFRIINEIPVLIMAVIVISVIVKPF